MYSVPCIHIEMYDIHKLYTPYKLVVFVRVCYVAEGSEVCAEPSNTHPQIQTSRLIKDLDKLDANFQACYRDLSALKADFSLREDDAVTTKLLWRK